MRPAVLVASVAALSSAPSTEAFTRPERPSARHARVVSMSTERKAVGDPVRRDRLRLRRRGTIEAGLDNEKTLYLVNGTVGSPGQHVRMHLDTGSSDLWLNTPSSSLCQREGSPCAYAGTYTANSSSTYKYMGSHFNISYVDGTGASGDYVSDTLILAGTTLPDLQFGIGYHSSSTQGILGLGYVSNEVQVGRARMKAYDNLPAKMAAEGKIQTNAYSLWLNDLDSSTGNILFGGIDTDKYTGTLHTLPVERVGGIYREFLTTLTGLSMVGSSRKAIIAEGQALAVLLDSGSSLTYLPDTWVTPIFNQVGATWDEEYGAAYVPCSMADSASTIDFTFSEPMISVPMKEMVLELFTSSGSQPTYANGDTACLFGIAPARVRTSVLGDTFLRSAYVVYDLANNEISLAQTRFNASASSVREIAPGAAGVPGAVRVRDAVVATQGLATYGSGAAGGRLTERSALLRTALLAWPVVLFLLAT